MNMKGILIDLSSFPSSFNMIQAIRMVRIDNSSFKLVIFGKREDSYNFSSLKNVTFLSTDEDRLSYALSNSLFLLASSPKEEILSKLNPPCDLFFSRVFSFPNKEDKVIVSFITLNKNAIDSLLTRFPSFCKTGFKLLTSNPSKDDLDYLYKSPCFKGTSSFDLFKDETINSFLSKEDEIKTFLDGYNACLGNLDNLQNLIKPNDFNSKLKKSFYLKATSYIRSELTTISSSRYLRINSDNDVFIVDKKISLTDSVKVIKDIISEF